MLYRRRARSVNSGPFSAAEIADMVANNGLKCIYDTRITSSVVLNGNDVSGLQDLSSNGNNLSQGNAANQPLFTGAPSYNSWPSIAFTAANADTLAKTSTNFIGTGPVTLVMVVRLRTAGVTGVLFGNDSGAGGTELVELTGNRGYIAVGVANLSDGAANTSTPEVWIVSDPATGAAGSFYVNGTVVLSPATTHNDPGGAAAISLGSRPGAVAPSDMDLMFAAGFNQAANASFAASLTARLRAGVGV